MIDSLYIGLRTEFDSDILDQLADALAPRLEKIRKPSEDSWIDSKEAAVYLGVTQASLYQHTAARAIPFSQNEVGGKMFFKRSELDAWRRGEWKR